jgi:hypothetical protein
MPRILGVTHPAYPRQIFATHSVPTVLGLWGTRMTTTVQLKAKVHRDWADYLEQGDKLRAGFQRAGIPVPDELKTLLGGGPSAQTTTLVFKPNTPPDAGDDWIWVDIPSASTTTLMLAILHEEKLPLFPKTILQKMMECGEPHNGTVINTIYNSIKRLEGTTLTRSEEGAISITQAENIPVLFEARLWGPISAFPASSELASHRREAEIFLLKKFGPQQRMQLVRQLEHFEMLNKGIPLSKDLVKGDLDLMNGKRVRQLGSSKKWEAI